MQSKPLRPAWSGFRRMVMVALLAWLVSIPSAGLAQQAVEDLFKQAQAFEQERDYAGAEGAYRKVLASDPSNPEALKRLGIVEQTGLKFDESIEHFKLVLAQHPDYAQVNFFLGLSYYGQHDLNNAIASFDRELKTSAPHPATRYYLAVVLEAAGRTNDALNQLNQLDAQSPGNANVLYDLARLHMDASFRALGQLRKLDPDSFQIHAFMGRLFLEERHYEAAVTEFRAALRRQPDALGIHYPLGAAYRMLHQFEDAEKEFLLALQESPNDPLASLGLGDIALLQKQFSKALPFLKKAAAGQPDNAETHILLGRCYIGLGELQQAKEELLLAARLDPSAPRTHYFLADVYQKLNQPADRQRELDEFNKLSVGNKAGAEGSAENDPAQPQENKP